jgi:hypothetical protein
MDNSQVSRTACGPLTRMCLAWLPELVPADPSIARPSEGHRNTGTSTLVRGSVVVIKVTNAEVFHPNVGPY